MVRGVASSFAVVGLASAAAPPSSFQGRRCRAPSGYRIADCRVARHGTPDLSRSAWRALRGAEVTISDPVTSLAPNPAAGRARAWPGDRLAGFGPVRGPTDPRVGAPPPAHARLSNGAINTVNEYDAKPAFGPGALFGAHAVARRRRTG